MSEGHLPKQFLGELWNKIFKKQLPWDENWKLDNKFFKAMEAWREQHPDSTLLKVMEKVNDAVSKNLPFAELVPDAPFPARGVVNSLAHLLALGVNVARTKDEVSEFTWAVITWVSTVEANGARITLQLIRNLINEICKWGWARLRDGRWIGLTNGISIAEEIRVFNEKLSAVRELLLNFQVNTLAVGVDAILDQIREIKTLQRSQLRPISEETMTAEERDRFLQQTLIKVALSNTAYDDQGKPPCDQDTRVGILADIKRWVDDVSSRGQNFFWLTGDSGCGKSAIAASLAKYCNSSGTLWAQFFINRNNEATSNPRLYFPSIARQMAKHTTSDQTVTKTICAIIERWPTMLDVPLNHALGLFVETVQAACDLDPSRAVTIVIDGFDETQRDKLEDTVEAFSQLFKDLKRQNVKVFISSRTDDEITKPFFLALRSNERHVKHVHLNTSDPSSIEDVSRYLFRNIKLLTETWDLNWEQWPGEERMKLLCTRANGLFVWAVTVVQFFREQLRQSKHQRLNELLDVINEEGMEDLNTLYGKILEITYRAETNTEAQNERECENFRWIVGFTIGLREPLPIRDTATLLDLRHPTSNPVDIFLLFITNLRMVLVAGTGDISNDTIPRLHKSFVEYVTSERADAKFRIDVPWINGQIAKQCLRLVGRIGLKNVPEAALLPASVRYAIHNWTSHLSSKGTSESGIGIVDGDAEGLLKILPMAGLKKGFMLASGNYRTHMFDPAIGLPPTVSPVKYSHRSTIRRSNGILTVAVSPNNKWIASGDLEGVIQVWDSNSDEPLIGGSARFNAPATSVGFSPDSRWLLSDGRGMSLMQDYGPRLGFPHLVSTSWVVGLGTKIVSLRTNVNYPSILDAHKLIGPVQVVALSADHIAAGVDYDVCLFDIETQQQIPMEGHTNYVSTLAFSPDGTRIASGSMDTTVRIWDVQARKQTHRLRGHTGHVRSVAFYPDGHWIASGGDDRTIRVWNADTGRPLGPPLTGHTDLVTSVTFSPDGRLISGSLDCTIRIWSVVGKWQKLSQQITAIHLSRHSTSFPDDRIPLQGHPSVISACCSPDGSVYAASTVGGRVSIWNSKRKLCWETNTSMIHPIHLLRFSETQLVLSAPDGSTASWNLSDGKPTHQEAITRRPQLNGLTNSVNDISWFPFHFDAGLWAYVDGCIINFEGEERNITIVDLRDFTSG